MALPYHFLDFSMKGYAVTNQEDFDKKDEELNRENQVLESKDISELIANI